MKMVGLIYWYRWRHRTGWKYWRNGLLSDSIKPPSEPMLKCQGTPIAFTFEQYDRIVITTLPLKIAHLESHPHLPGTNMSNLDVNLSTKLNTTIPPPHAPLQWRHNERDGVSHHRRHVCLLNRLLRRKSKKTSKLRVTGLCQGNSPVTGEFPAHRPVT